MKNLFFLLLLSAGLFLSFVSDKDKKIDVELVSIEYYSKGICNNDNPVYIRVIYSVNETNFSLLKMKHEFSNGITATMPITEIDKKGNIVYGFCSGKDEVKVFKTIFISQDGSQSNEIFIHINVPEAKIIAGTAPQTIKKQ